MTSPHDGNSHREPNAQSLGHSENHPTGTTHVFETEEAFQRLLSRFNGSTKLAAQAIGIEEKTLLSWLGKWPSQSPDVLHESDHGHVG
ncbi:MAG: hypothetical protein K1Y02_14970 [Candidatus Hydrogenedentes bacterium]|nr:hypothetical protein [Candidatus Hydrogenedentota bacterium]